MPIHADTWNGVSAFDLNIWVPLVDCTKSMCLYILKRDEYLNALEIYPNLLEKSSIQIFEILKSSLTWIEIKYGDILAFDQSLPHGYDVNNEEFTQWSMNCRFKNIFSPYSDKKLGEYYVPITVRSTTRIGVGYQNPSQWISKKYPMKQKARGYISSGVYRGYRTPQHIQNQIIKIYCEKNDFDFLFSGQSIFRNSNCKSITLLLR